MNFTHRFAVGSGINVVILKLFCVYCGIKETNKYRCCWEQGFITEKGRFKYRWGWLKKNFVVMDLNAKYQDPLNPILVFSLFLNSSNYLQRIDISWLLFSEILQRIKRKFTYLKKRLKLILSCNYIWVHWTFS